MVEGDSGDPSKSLSEQQKAANAQSKSNQAEGSADPPVLALPKENGVSTPSAQSQASQHQQDGSDSPANRSIATSTKYIAVLTGALVVTSIIGIVSSLLQWQVIRNQLDIMRTDERAWLSMDVDVVGTKELSEKGKLSIPLKISVDNMGKLPARDVTVAVIVSAGYSETREQQIDISRTCDQADNVTEMGEGDVIFPGKSIDPHLVNYQNDGIVNKRDSFKSDVFMFACVSYLVDGGQRRGHTTVIKEIDIVQMTSETPILKASVEAKPVFILQRQRLD